MTDELKRESERFVRLAAQATPGPWGIEGRNWSYSIENCEGYGVASVHVHPQDYRNRKADADFIAAAPDMAAHIAKLQAALDEARKDAERIDWLAAKAKTCTVRMNGQHPWSLRVRELQGPSFRHAIDAAMERRP